MVRLEVSYPYDFLKLIKPHLLSRSLQEHMEFDNFLISKPKFLPEPSMMQQQEFRFLSKLLKSAAGRFFLSLVSDTIFYHHIPFCQTK